ncbi:hypothetical protein HUJ04_009735 [Dendroctonus ponderosae]|nr:hypothetical protein HUJ04_009735 [Dendroctonus ponderosae]
MASGESEKRKRRENARAVSTDGENFKFLLALVFTLQFFTEENAVGLRIISRSVVSEIPPCTINTRLLTMVPKGSHRDVTAAGALETPTVFQVRGSTAAHNY